MTKIIEKQYLENKKVIIRCDLNVPIKDNIIQDETRIIESLKTITYVLKYAKKVIILSHLGRIKCVKDKEKNSLSIVCKKLSELLNQDIKFVTYEDNILKEINNNKIVMLENTRFFDLDNKKESNNDIELSKYFSSFGDVFINDAFGTCHRANASNVGISRFLPSFLGFLVEKEINMLDSIKNSPEQPFIVIMGGAKISDKISLIESLIKKVDKLIITGAMSFSFLKVKGYNVGKSLVDVDSLDFCRKILEKYDKKIILPLDYYVGEKFSNDTKKILKHINDFSENEIGLDIGPKTIELYKQELKCAKTVFLNGPAGVFEFSNFTYGTDQLCSILSSLHANVVIGGGDSASAVRSLGYKFKNISTGGGAALEYIEGKCLPGLNIGEENEEV